MIISPRTTRPNLDANDSDLGSGGPMLLPDQSGANPHLAVVEGKGGILYLVDRDHMGHWQPGNNSHAVQTMAVPNGVFGSMAYWNHYVYVLSDGDALRQFAVIDGKLSPKAASGFPGVSATPTISANGLKRRHSVAAPLQRLERIRPARGSLRLRCCERGP